MTTLKDERNSRIRKIEEENNMSIHKILKADLIGVFCGRDPLDFIEDVRVMEYPDRATCEVILTLPSMPELAMRPFVTDECLQSAIGGAWCSPGAPKAPEPTPIKKQIDPVDAVGALKPKRIIYSGPKTIVFWPDGTKTMVSLMEGQEHDDYTAYCAAVVKKMFGATHKAKKFINSVAVRQESNPRKPKQETEEMMTVELQTLGSEEVREVPVKPWETTPTMPMPGTEDPEWGRKHWCSDAPVLVKEDTCDAE